MVISSSRSKKTELTSDEAQSPAIGLVGWARWIWRQLTSMRTALILLLMLAAAAVPGSIYPQRSADPNGVTTFFDNNPDLAKVLDGIQMFDVYSSAWFSAIYILLFISLIGCVIPRTIVHARNLREEPVETPTNLRRMPAFLAAKASKLQLENSADLIDSAAALLRRQRYRVAVREDQNGAKTVSAERGYLRETGNLVFHIALLGVLFAVGIGGGYSYNGQRVVVEGETFVNNLAGYDSFSPGAFFKPEMLTPFSMTLDKFEVKFDLQNRTNIGTPLDFRAYVTSRIQNGDGTTTDKNSVIRVNEPLELPGSHVYLTGNGYAPVITIRDRNGDVAFSGPTEYLPQDKNY
ncbi:MAG: cytochrome c biogenesis protein ResB, partial [Micrococcales bacterium]